MIPMGPSLTRAISEMQRRDKAIYKSNLFTLLLLPVIAILPIGVDRFVGLLVDFISTALEEKCGNVWCTDGRVDDKNQNEPVPDGFERRVVKYCPAMMSRHLQLVLR